MTRDPNNHLYTFLIGFFVGCAAMAVVGAVL